MELKDIKIGDNVTLIDRPCSGYVTKILPLEEERWGFRSQKILVEWEAYSGAFPPNEYQRLRHIKLIGIPHKPKLICYCGSIRVALEAFKKAEYESLMRGDIALLPCCMFVDIQREYGVDSDYKQKADDLHKRKIDICDEVFVLNVNGYIGDSTRSEIEYANSIGKTVLYLEPLRGGGN